MKKAFWIGAGAVALVSLIVVGAVGRVEGELGRQAVAFAADHERHQREAEAFYRDDIQHFLSDPDAAFLHELWAPNRRNDKAADALVGRLKTGLAPLVGCDATTVTVNTTYNTDLGLFRDTRRTEVGANFATRCLFGNALVQTMAEAQKTVDGWRLTKLQLGNATPLRGKTP